VSSRNHQLLNYQSNLASFCQNARYGFQCKIVFMHLFNLQNQFASAMQDDVRYRTLTPSKSIGLQRRGRRAFTNRGPVALRRRGPREEDFARYPAPKMGVESGTTQ
jgi:hypothetical protein